MIAIDLALVCCITLIVLIRPFQSKMQSATLWVGKMIAPTGQDKMFPTGWQDAVTPKLQDFLNGFLPICFLAVVVLGTIRMWYLGALAVIAALFIAEIIAAFLAPKKVLFYMRLIMHEMDNRIADYARKGDLVRSEAAADMTLLLYALYFKTEEEDPDLPRFEDICAMPLQGEN